MGTPTDRPVTAADVPWIVALHDAPHARAFLPQPAEDVVRASVGREGYAERVIELDGVPAGLWRARLEEPWLVEVRTLIAARPGEGVGGYGLRAALAWAFVTCEVHRTSLCVAAANERARRLYERHGMRCEGTFRDGFRARNGSYEDLCCYGMLAAEYAAWAQTGTMERP